MDTDLKMWSELKSNIISGFVYYKGFIFFNFIWILLLLFLVDKLALLTVLIVILVLFNLILLNLIGKKRNEELSSIRKIIYNIRKSNFNSPEEIKLNRSLFPLQEEIQIMFENMKRDIDNLKRLERVRREFLGNVSHELRTPIFAIQGYIETLLDGALDDKKVNRSFLQKANNHTLSLNNLLNDLIEISMIESGEMRMSFRYFEITGFIKNLTDEYKEAAESKGLELLFIPPPKSFQVYGDKDKLKQVMINLIVNAIKYTEKGKIEIKIEEEKLKGRIIVKDTGMGIPEDDMGRIFERFYRVDKARARNVGGSGLGLAIVKHIIEAHGGSIEVKSVIEKGSEFSFRLKK